MNRERVDVTAMCLSCGTTRKARADRVETWTRLCRPELRCKTCGVSTSHEAVDREATYGHVEDGLRYGCGEVNRLLAELEMMPNVDVRWSEASWCFAHSAAFGLSLEWVAEHPGESVPCVCESSPEVQAGAQPAGIVVKAKDRWLVELDSRPSRERLEQPLRQLRHDLLAGELTKSCYLSPAYNVRYEVAMTGAKLQQNAGSEASQ